MLPENKTSLCKQDYLAGWNIFLVKEIYFNPLRTRIILFHIQKETEPLINYIHLFVSEWECAYSIRKTPILFEIVIKWQHILEATEKMKFQENYHFKRKQLVNRELILSFPEENGQWLLLCGISTHSDLPEGNC